MRQKGQIENFIFANHSDTESFTATKKASRLTGLNSFVSRLINFYNQSQKQTFLLSDCQNNRNFTDVIL